MNKIKLLYDVVKTMKEKEVFEGRLNVEGKKDEISVLSLVNKFAANHQSGDVKADISLEVDCQGNKVKHESSLEFNKKCCPGHLHHQFKHDASDHGSCCGIKSKL